MKPRLVKKADAEAERLTKLWEREHPAPDLSALELAMRKAGGMLDAIRNNYCRAHATGNLCICPSHPDYPEAVERVKAAQIPYYAALAVRAAERQRIRSGYYRTLIRGIQGREAWNARY